MSLVRSQSQQIFEARFRCESANSKVALTFIYAVAFSIVYQGFSARILPSLCPKKKLGMVGEQVPQLHQAEGFFGSPARRARVSATAATKWHASGNILRGLSLGDRSDMSEF